MHFGFLSEDQSGKAMLDLLLPRLIPAAQGHTFKVHSYKGIGHIPKRMKPSADVGKRILLDQLPRLLRGYGKAFEGFGEGYRAVVIIVCDLDDRNQTAFEKELGRLVATIELCPTHAFCLAIEEGEAWLLGDVRAVRAAYPQAKRSILDTYKQDSICGTWERLADAVHKGGAQALRAEGWWRVGLEKTRWAEKITPHMDPDGNQSPSFNHFISKVGKFVQSA